MQAFSFRQILSLRIFKIRIIKSDGRGLKQDGKGVMRGEKKSITSVAMLYAPDADMPV